MFLKTHEAAAVVAAFFAVMTAFIFLGSTRIISSTDCRLFANGSQAFSTIEQAGAIPGAQKTEHQNNPSVHSPVAALPFTLSLPEPDVAAESFHLR
ncbi:MAG: hypothetical protein MUC50_22845, partial [Myxococcota bacterium]|nr:hypothetical protein [Myxococcota bacterium]